MITAGCDYHPGFQQIVFVDADTGELRKRRPQHREETEVLPRSRGTRDECARGDGAGRHARWLERLLAELLLERYRDRATTTWNLLDFNGTDCLFLIL